MLKKRQLPRVAVIILNLNAYEMTADCLDSLAGIEYPDFEIILVDNGSSDGSPRFFKERYPAVRLIENEMNRGFTGGNNQGIEYALEKGFDYVLLLNNDTVVSPSFLSVLVQAGEAREDVAMLNPKIYFHGSAKLLWYGGGRVSFFRGVETFGFKRQDEARYNQLQEVSFNTGCALLIKTTALKQLGLLDNRLFMYCEDLDWSLKAGKAGYKGLYVPAAVVWHRQALDSRKDELQAFRKYLGARNLLFVFRNHFSRARFSLFFLYYVFLWGPGKSVRHLLRGELQTMLHIWKGVIAFLRMKKGWR